MDNSKQYNVIGSAQQLEVDTVSTILAQAILWPMARRLIIRKKMNLRVYFKVLDHT